MSVPARLLRRLLHARLRVARNIDTRFQKARPGSVLILVVALLVLMALMGTAYISTTGVDRASSAQNTFNTEIDLLIQGLCEIEQQALLNATGAPTNTPTTSDDATIWTSFVDSPLLAARVPVSNGNGSPPVWGQISGPPLNNAVFESPLGGQQYPSTQPTNVMPSSVPVTIGSVTSVYPALTFDGNTKYLAASASGSGIADSALFRLPVGEVNGITYYGATFTVDNSSAINASIAYEPGNGIYQPNVSTPTLPGDLFPSSLDLADMLRAGTGSGAASASIQQQLNALNSYRFGTAPTSVPATAIPTAGLTPYYDTPVANPTPMPYQFTSPLEAMWMQLGRRLDNPGVYMPGGSPNGNTYYQPLPIGESMAMGYHYCLMNAAASPSLLEQYLAPSVAYTGQYTGGTTPNVIPIRTSPYSPDQSQQWFNDNFVYDNNGGNIRPLMVARNQVSNISGSRFTYRNSTQTTQNNNWDALNAYNFGDWVTGSDGKTYVAIQNNTDQPPQLITGAQPFWAQEPWLDYPIKTSVNTGTFGQLWLAYWSVMSYEGADQPDPNASAAMFRDPIRSQVNVSASGTSTGASSSSPSGSGSGNTWNVPAGSDANTINGIIIRSAPGDTISFSAGTYTFAPSTIGSLQFLPGRTYNGGGTPSGVVGFAGLTSAETMRLRAAISAINTQQLRSDNSQILTHQIGLAGAITSPTVSGATTGGATLALSSGVDRANQYYLVAVLGGAQVSGFTFTSTEILVEGAGNNIHDNSFTNGSIGIFINGASNSEYNHNTFSNLGSEGIYTYFFGNNSTFDNNTFVSVWEPIHLVSNVTGVDVSGNVMSGTSRIGIELQNAMNGLTVTNNWIGQYVPYISNGVDSHMGISAAVGNANGVTISGNTLLMTGDTSNWAMSAMELMGSNVTVTNNTAWNWANNILNGLQGGTNVVSGNHFMGEFSLPRTGRRGRSPRLRPLTRCSRSVLTTRAVRPRLPAVPAARPSQALSRPHLRISATS